MAENFADPNEPIRIPITDVFDLHSVPPRDVRGVVEAYLEEAHQIGFRAIRIIHGRGIGVQREIVRAVLARTSFVLSYGDAPPEAGGWGATIAALGAALK
jgi:dsDNA-specific endonuclease/ATPase MutS2